VNKFNDTEVVLIDCEIGSCDGCVAEGDKLHSSLGRFPTNKDLCGLCGAGGIFVTVDSVQSKIVDALFEESNE